MRFTLLHLREPDVSGLDPEISNGGPKSSDGNKRMVRSRVEILLSHTGEIERVRYKL